MELFFEILLAALAVFGLWCAMRLWTERAVGSTAITLTVRVLDRQAEQELRGLLREAHAMLSWRRRVPLVVLYDRALLPDGETVPEVARAAIDAFGAHCFVVDVEENDEGSDEI